MLALANPTIAKENQSPRLKPKTAPATMTPKATNPPITMMFLRKEKSLLVKKTVAVNPANIKSVTSAA